eukprot:gb/GEZN01004991.1/.p1 GENE.gb/GEZN01004991.1/~~gb/GEZN01004991.1/.p1  ORF type:complete len:551 (-),score=128.61 gb/GEZN01004991.1/:119-1771(-)
MSSGTSYISEPETTGKVVVSTTFGDLDVELWCKECPLACKNFIQLCLEGYYDNCLVTRVIKDFMVQTGDPTGTGGGGESIYGDAFKDEFHSRLRFSRRGLLAMANSGKNSNQSQFFFTLGPTPWLQKKNTLFGKVTGDTVYNLIKMNDMETDAEDKPALEQRIIKTDVVLSPFTDIIPRLKVDDKPKKKKEKKKKKKLELLSFGEEADALEQELDKVLAKPAAPSIVKSVYDVKESANVQAGDEETDVLQGDAPPRSATSVTDGIAAAESVRSKLTKRKTTENMASSSHPKTEEELFELEMTEKVLKQQLEKRNKEIASSEPEKITYSASIKKKPKSELEEEYKEMREQFEKDEAKKARKRAKEEKELAKKSGATRSGAFKRAMLPDDQILSNLEKRQVKYRKFKRGGAKEREEDTLSKLEVFGNMLKQAPEVLAEKERLEETLRAAEEAKEKAKQTTEQEEEKNKGKQTEQERLEIEEKVSSDDEEDNTIAWLAHKIKFPKRPQDYRPVDEQIADSFAVFDPLDKNQQERPEVRKIPNAGGGGRGGGRG